MRAARVRRRTGSTARPLVLAVHGSADPRFGEVAGALRDAVAARRPGLPVRIGYLDHGVPDLGAVVSADSVVVPVMLTRGYHVQRDIPARSRTASVADAIGPDPMVAAAVADRLRAAGWRVGMSVALVAAGSARAGARADVRRVARELAAILNVEVTAGFVGSGTPHLPDIGHEAVATYLLSPGRFADRINHQAAAAGSRIVSQPIGAHPLLAEVVLRRYDESVAATAQLPAQRQVGAG